MNFVKRFFKRVWTMLSFQFHPKMLAVDTGKGSTSILMNENVSDSLDLVPVEKKKEKSRTHYHHKTRKQNKKISRRKIAAESRRKNRPKK